VGLLGKDRFDIGAQPCCDRCGPCRSLKSSLGSNRARALSRLASTEKIDAAEPDRKALAYEWRSANDDNARSPAAGPGPRPEAGQKLAGVLDGRGRLESCCQARRQPALLSLRGGELCSDPGFPGRPKPPHGRRAKRPMTWARARFFPFRLLAPGIRPPAGEPDRGATPLTGFRLAWARHAVFADRLRRTSAPLLDSLGDPALAVQAPPATGGWDRMP